MNVTLHLCVRLEVYESLCATSDITPSFGKSDRAILTVPWSVVFSFSQAVVSQTLEKNSCWARALRSIRRRHVRGVYQPLHSRHWSVLRRWVSAVSSWWIRNRRRLEIGYRFYLHVLLIVTRNCFRISEHCVMRWLCARQKRCYGASSMDLPEDEGKNKRGVHCICWCQIRNALGRRGRVRQTLLRLFIWRWINPTYIINVHPLRPLFTRWLFRLYNCKGHQYCVNHVVISSRTSHGAPDRKL